MREINFSSTPQFSRTVSGLEMCTWKIVVVGGSPSFDELVQIPVFCEFHDDGKGRWCDKIPARDEELFVSNDVGM